MLRQSGEDGQVGSDKQTMLRLWRNCERESLGFISGKLRAGGRGAEKAP